MVSEKYAERQDALNSKVNFINEAYLTLNTNSESFSVDLATYDLENPVSVATAQKDLAMASQYVSALTEKVDFNYHDFLALSDSFEMLFRDFYIGYIEENPRQRGYPDELYSHTVSTKFCEEAGWDRAMVSQIMTKFKQLQKTLEYRREHLKDVTYQLKAIQKNLEFSLSTQGGSQIIRPGETDSFLDVSQPNPTQHNQTKRYPNNIPPPAVNPPVLPPGFRLGTLE